METEIQHLLTGLGVQAEMVVELQDLTKQRWVFVITKRKTWSERVQTLRVVFGGNFAATSQSGAFMSSHRQSPTSLGCMLAESHYGEEMLSS